MSPHVIFISGPPQVQVGHTGCLVAAFLTAFRACLQVMRMLCFCVMAHQRCDVGQHLKSYGSRRVAKRDSDGWLVVSVGLFSECGTSTCLLGNVWTFLPSRCGGHNCIIVSLGRVGHQCASVFTCLSVLFSGGRFLSVNVLWFACPRGASPSCKLSFVLPRRLR